MRALGVYQSLGAIDLLSVARDSTARWLVLLAPGSGLLFRYAVPAIAATLEKRFGFDLTIYYPLVASVLPLIVAGMIGTVVGFLLLDQRDEQTLPALLVTPLSLISYLRYRMVVLLVLCVTLSSLTVPIAGLTVTSILQVVTAAVVAAPLAPLYALFLGSFAGNKVQGFALAKAVGVVAIPAFAAYFVTGPWQIAFGVVPHYWPLKVFWLFDAGATQSALAYAAVGLVWQAVLVVWLARRFARVVRS